MKTACREVIKKLEGVKRVVAFTGAGISAESGIPTFRGNGGLWGEYRVEEVATPEAFDANPRLVWDFYLERRRGVLQAKPNPAHFAFANWQNRFPFVGVVTQNIDGLHEKAGSREIRELHGNIWKVRCTKCGKLDTDQATTRKELPNCQTCGGLLRPHIIWFGEALDPGVVSEAVAWLRNADIVFVVEPAASFVRDAKHHGAFIVEINVEKTALSGIADISIFG